MVTVVNVVVVGAGRTTGSVVVETVEPAVLLTGSVVVVGDRLAEVRPGPRQEKAGANQEGRARPPPV